MKLTILSLALSALASAAAVPAEQQQDITIPGDIVPATWLVRAFTDGPDLTLQGTVQEVHAQLKQINANYDRDFGIPAASEAEESQLHRRTDFRNTHTICGNFPHIGITHLAEGINYLRHVGGRPQLPPRGATSVCSRVSCSYSTAIWWCNDVSLPSVASFCFCLSVLERCEAACF